MNFLAHAYLSFNDPQLLAGNMISDFVKGREQFSFNGNIRAGIQLHRRIDEFTDTHPATARAKEVFRSAYRLYSGPITDILYDHFLANDPTVFNEASLMAFTQQVYRQLEEQAAELPQRFLTVFAYMHTDNWLYGYRLPDGIRRSLAGLVRRSSFLTESDTAFRLFQEHYDLLGSCYAQFFPDVKQFAKRAFDAMKQ